MLNEANFRERYEELKSERSAIGGFDADLNERYNTGEPLTEADARGLLMLWHNAARQEHEHASRLFDLLRETYYWLTSGDAPNER